MVMLHVRRALLLLFPAFVVPVRALIGFPLNCDLECTINGKSYKHILCEFQHQTNKGICTDIKGKMSPKDRMWVMAAHNRKRNYEVYKGVSCMRQLRWSYVLEEAAQIYAEQCKEKTPYHCARDYVEEYEVWMNVYETENPLSGMNLMIDATLSWVDPKPSSVSPENWKLNYSWEFNAWAAVNYWQAFEIGCGRSEYKKHGQNWGTVVCLYGPGINDMGPKDRVLYKKGSWYTRGCNPALCQHRYGSGLIEPSGSWNFICASPQDRYAWNYLEIPDPSGPQDLEFVPPRLNVSSAPAHPQLSKILTLSPVFGILNWKI